MFRNSEGYADPTAGSALAHITAEERAQRRLWLWLKAVLNGPAYMADAPELEKVSISSIRNGGKDGENAAHSSDR